MFHAVAEVQGKLYAIGGSACDRAQFTVDDLEPLSSVERFDPGANTWEAVAPMCTARVNCSAAVLAGKLYVAGGENGTDDWRPEHERFSTVERYDPVTNSWEAVADMSAKRCSLALCS